MSIFDSIDLSKGELPGWIGNLVALARPAALTMTTAIPALGAFTVGAVAFRWPEAADAMAGASVKFLQGIPDAAWGAITAIALGYTAAKTTEVIKKPGSAPAQPTEPEPPVQSDAPQLTEAALEKLKIPQVEFGDRGPTETME